MTLDKIQLYKQTTICQECKGNGFYSTSYDKKISCVYCAGTGKELVYKKGAFLKTKNDIYNIGATANRHIGIIMSSKENAVLMPLLTIKFNK
jgi:hypothetical protein